MALDNQQIVQALALLGMTPVEFLQIRQSTTVGEATRKLDALKARAKKAYKQQAIRLHPDQTGNDPEKTEQFKLLSSFLKELESIQVAVRPRPMPMPINFNTGTYSVRVHIRVG